jgi:MFS family permease
MAGRDGGETPRKRFSRTGHTSHQRDRDPASPAPQSRVPRPPPAQYPPAQYPLAQYPPSPDDFGTTSYHHGAPPPVPGAIAPPIPGGPVTRAARATQHGAKFVTRKVITASEANGARESGLTPLIWNQVLSYGTDAMITVALASTVFFGASAHAQRGNVLLYLLVTMAPFALIAPVIGPALDRVQHGRRWAMAATAIGRAVLALIMAGHPTDLLVLYPCALGSLVLSKAYGVIRSAASPRLVPPGMTLVEANARLSMFGLGAAVVGGGFVAGVIKLTGSYTTGLIVTAIAFAACAFFSIKLPPQVDSLREATLPTQQPGGGPGRSALSPNVTRFARFGMWARRGFLPRVISTLQAEAALRFMTGFLTIFMAFYIESTRHGWSAAAALGAVLGAAGVGNFLGTATGARLTSKQADLIVIICSAVAAVACLLVAVLYSLNTAVIGMLITAAANALGKLGLDAVIQHDVPEVQRSSAFARSETFLQLTWVIGAALGCLLPSSNGSIGFWVAGAVVGLVSGLIGLRVRAVKRSTRPRPAAIPPGTVERNEQY